MSIPAGEAAVFSQEAPRFKPAPESMPLSGIAKLMLKHGVDAYPVEGGRVVQISTIIGAVKDTGAFAKREARTIMCPTPVVKERRVKNAQNAASESGLDVVPVVNESGHLVASWVNGKVTRRPLIVKAGTHVRLVVDKVMRGPVIVVDKHRAPLGVITKSDFLELAASFKEYEVSVFYSGLESLAGGDREALKEQVLATVQKASKLTPAFHASFRLSKRGVWAANLKLSTPLRTFLATGEAEKRETAVAEALDRLVQEVMHEKEKRTKLRR